MSLDDPKLSNPVPMLIVTTHAGMGDEDRNAFHRSISAFSDCPPPPVLLCVWLILRACSPFRKSMGENDGIEVSVIEGR